MIKFFESFCNLAIGKNLKSIRFFVSAMYFNTMAIYPTFILSIQHNFAKPLCGTAKIQRGNLLADASVSFLCRLTRKHAKDLSLKLDTQICFV